MHRLNYNIKLYCLSINILTIQSTVIILYLKNRLLTYCIFVEYHGIFSQNNMFTLFYINYIAQKQEVIFTFDHQSYKIQISTIYSLSKLLTNKI